MTLFLILLLLGGQLFRQRPHLIIELLVFLFLFLEKASLFLNPLFIQRHPALGDERFLKELLLIITAIAVINPFNEFKKPAERHHCISGSNISCRMHRQISQLHNQRQLLPRIIFHGIAEIGLMNQGLQIILKRKCHGPVCRIDPLHRQLQRLAAADGTHGRRSRIDPFCLHGRRSKRFIFLFPA